MVGFGENEILYDGGGVTIVKSFRVYSTSLDIAEIYSMQISFIVLFIVWICGDTT
jgi:ABC-type multidrug transport system permease subunit